jgi:hypothetical protein
VRRAWFLAVLVVAGCQVGPAAPGPAVERVTAPPWDAPRDVVSYIDAAGLERLPLNFRGPSSYLVTVLVKVDGKLVEVPSGIGIDLVRAEQAPLHTHDATGAVHVEARKADQHPTVAQFVTLWGVRHDAKCLGDACGGVTIRISGAAGTWDSPLEPGALIEVAARH